MTDREPTVYRGCASDRQGMLGARSRREPPGCPLPVAASYLHAGNHVRKHGSTRPRGLRAAPFVKIDAAQDVRFKTSSESSRRTDEASTGRGRRPDLLGARASRPPRPEAGNGQPAADPQLLKRAGRPRSQGGLQENWLTCGERSASRSPGRVRWSPIRASSFPTWWCRRGGGVRPHSTRARPRGVADDGPPAPRRGRPPASHGP